MQCVKVKLYLKKSFICLQIGVALENFLEPCEQDLDLLLTYLKALGLGNSLIVIFMYIPY